MSNFKEPVDLGVIDQGITTKQFRRELAIAVRNAGGSTEAGKLWDVAPQNVGSAISGTKLPTKRILEVMGYTPVKEIKYRYKRIE